MQSNDTIRRTNLLLNRPYENKSKYLIMNYFPIQKVHVINCQSVASIKEQMGDKN